MNLQRFIDRPVLSTVISIVIFLLGVLGYNTLAVNQYPDIAPPTVMVTASYPGANAETIRESVIIPLEEQINGVEGMTYMTSTASNDGSASISVFFEQEYNADIAAVNVQNRVATASALLPIQVTQTGVITEKVQNSALMYVALVSSNPDYNETFITNYLNINIRPQLQRLGGINRVNVYGARDYSMRIWISPAKMANYGVTVSEVIQAINEQSSEVSAGALGQNNGEAFEYIVKYKGRLKEEAEYENIVIRTGAKGEFLRLGDVAEIEMDAFSYAGSGMNSGNPSVSFGLIQTPGSNAQEIAEEVYTLLTNLEDEMPEGLHFSYDYDTNRFLTASMNKVTSTLVEAFVLVFIVVLLFLQNVRSTLIPAIAVPVSIVGTFFFMNVMGLSLNLLTMFALILAIGIVVDDAIVVVEAVHSKLETGYKSARKATITAMNEISGAIVSITLVMVAVFAPVTFITGPSGVFYKQFAITLIISILISAVNALTLSPALTALFLKPHSEEEHAKGLLGRFYAAFNAAFDAFTEKYINSLKFLFKNKWVTVAILLVSGAGIFFTSKMTATGFVPGEDQGVIFANIELPEGASTDRATQVIKDLNAEVCKLEGVQSFSVFTGSSFFSGAGSSFAMGFITLNDWSERTTIETSIDGLIGQFYGIASGIPEANIVFFTPPSVSGFGDSNGIEARLVDRRDGSFTALNDVASSFADSLMQNPSLTYVTNSFNTGFPQFEMEVNVEKAKEANVNVSELFNTIQGYMGGIYAANFSKYGKLFRVMVQAKPEDRNNENSLDNMMVKNALGQMAPVSEFVTLKPVNGPQSVTRFNLQNSVTLNGMVAPGVSTGDAIAIFDDAAKKYLPKNYAIEYSGLTREEINSGNQVIGIFLLSLLFVYLILAAQYESYILPFAVIISLIVGVAGAFLTNMLRGLDNNIFFQIGLVMLIGLLAKNAILVVEYGLQKRKEGMDLKEAALEGARLRLRPIIMTSFAFIIGILPLVFASGVGANGNQSIGTGAAGGLLIGTVIGLLVIPALFVFFQWLHEKWTPSRIEEEEDDKAVVA